MDKHETSAPKHETKQISGNTPVKSGNKKEAFMDKHETSAPKHETKQISGNTPVKSVKQPEVSISPEEREKLRQLSQLSLWLDSYDDLFSDFDPRHYSQRALSDDFISESKKMVRERRSGKIELNLLMPADKRNSYPEGIIKKRLREHFKAQFDDLRKNKLQKLREGAIFIIVGIIVMITATILFIQQTEKTFAISFMVVLLEPAGWFLFWEGLNLMIFVANKNKANLHFNKKLSSCEISFSSY